MKRLLLWLIIGCIASMLLLAVAEMPPYGAPGNPANNYVVEYYLEQGLEHTGAINVITQIILDFRAFDTLIETTVLFTAIAAVALTLKATWPGPQSPYRNRHREHYPSQKDGALHG